MATLDQWAPYLLSRTRVDRPAVSPPWSKEDMERELHQRLGFPVIVNQVANRIQVFKKAQVGVLIGDVDEQELLASGRPHDMLHGACVLEARLPEHVVVPLFDGKGVQPFYVRTHTVDGGGLGVRVHGDMEHPDVYMFSTVTSGTFLDSRMARNHFADELAKFRDGCDFQDVCLVLRGGVSSFVNTVTGECQVWADVAVLPFPVRYDPESRTLQRA